LIKVYNQKYFFHTFFPILIVVLNINILDNISDLRGIFIMKKIILPLLVAGMLASCGPTSAPTVDPSIDPTTDPTVEPTVDSTVDPTVDPTTEPSGGLDITIDVPTDLGVDLTTIADAKKGVKGDYFYIYGIIAQFTYGYDGKVGFYIVDNTSSMYVYKGSGLENLKIGNAVLVNGEIDYFISQQEAGAGAEIGYLGAQQIKADNVEVINDKYTEIPDIGIEEKRIKELATTNFRDNDLSGTIFRVDATVTSSDVSGTAVYYFNDPSMDYSLYTYSTMGGGDFDWVKPYVGKTFEWTIAVHSLRSRDEAWRIIPIEPFMEVTISEDEKAEYALDRLAGQFADTYNTTTSIDLLNKDSKLENTTVTYASDNSAHSITTSADGYKLNIDATALGSFNITISLEYNGKTYTRIKTIEIIEKATFDGITIAEALSASEGDVVKIKGIYVRTAANVQGIYLADETGIIPVHHTAAFDPANYIVGEEMIFEGTVARDFTNSGQHPGYNKLSNATLISNDSAVHEWNTSLCSGELTIADLKSGNDDYVGKFYKVRGKVVTNATQHYTNKIFVDENDSNISMALYCGNASQIAWLDEYEGQVKDAYVFIRDKKNKNCRIEILDFVA
jgi:hypothetical protein